MSAQAVAFELNFDADFDTTEDTVDQDTKCSLNGSNKGVASWITISDGVNMYAPHMRLIEMLSDQEGAHFSTNLN